jgi:hypothetical protein
MENVAQTEASNVLSPTHIKVKTRRIGNKKLVISSSEENSDTSPTTDIEPADELLPVTKKSNHARGKNQITNADDPPKWQWELWLDSTEQQEKANQKNSGSMEEEKIMSIINPDDVSISLGKPFLYNDTLGWNWHKSWNIPSIFITIKPEKCSPSIKFRAQIKAIIFRTERSDKKNIGEIQISGNNTQELINGHAVFSKITFGSTSFQNHGAKFHLVITLTAEEPNSPSSPVHMLHSYISPAVFVDAKNRKKESVKITISEKLFLRFFHPFSPKLLKSSFIRKKKLVGKTQSLNIENSLRGLYEYLSATHIRFKTKHPLFLILKFSKCLKLFYNKNVKLPAMGSQTVEETLIVQFQTYLDAVDPKISTQSTIEMNPTALNLEKKHFVILIEQPKSVDSFYLTKTIYQNFEFIKHDQIHFTFSRSAIPESFVEIPTAKLESSYISCFTTLLKMKFKGSGEEDLDNSQFDEDDMDNELDDESDDIVPKEENLDTISTSGSNLNPDSAKMLKIATNISEKTTTKETIKTAPSSLTSINDSTPLNGATKTNAMLPMLYLQQQDNQQQLISEIAKDTLLLNYMNQMRQLPNGMSTQLPLLSDRNLVNPSLPPVKATNNLLTSLTNAMGLSAAANQASSPTTPPNASQQQNASNLSTFNERVNLQSLAGLSGLNSGIAGLPSLNLGGSSMFSNAATLQQLANSGLLGMNFNQGLNFSSLGGGLPFGMNNGLNNLKATSDQLTLAQAIQNSQAASLYNPQYLSQHISLPTPLGLSLPMLNNQSQRNMTADSNLLYSLNQLLSSNNQLNQINQLNQLNQMNQMNQLKRSF